MKRLARPFRQRLLLTVHRLRWRLANLHNDTEAHNVFPKEIVHVGRYSYGPIRVIDGHGSSHLWVGDFCSIAEDVTFILSGEHPIQYPLTFPLRTFMTSEPESALSRGDIRLGDDVWVGHGATVMSGVTLGQGCVIGAGTVVTKDVAPYAIVVGSPARTIGFRFRDEVITRLLALSLQKVTADLFQTHAEVFERPIDDGALSLLELLLSRDHRPT